MSAATPHPCQHCQEEQSCQRQLGRKWRHWAPGTLTYENEPEPRVDSRATGRGYGSSPRCRGLALAGQGGPEVGGVRKMK